METLPKIVRLGRTLGAQFNNARHAQYHRELYELVNGVDQQKLHLPPTLMKA